MEHCPAGRYLHRIDHLTLQPRDFNIAEEAQYDRQFIDEARAKTPDMQPWLFAEWVERERPRPTDKGEVPSTQMQKVFPALTWEESMGAMLLYVEDVQRKIAVSDKGAKPVRVLPSNLAMGWIRHQIEHGEFPGVGRDGFLSVSLPRYASIPNPNGALSYGLDLVCGVLSRIARRESAADRDRSHARAGDGDAAARVGRDRELSRLRDFRGREDTRGPAGVFAHGASDRRCHAGDAFVVDARHMVSLHARWHHADTHDWLCLLRSDERPTRDDGEGHRVQERHGG